MEFDGQGCSNGDVARAWSRRRGSGVSPKPGVEVFAVPSRKGEPPNISLAGCGRHEGIVRRVSGVMS